MVAEFDSSPAIPGGRFPAIARAIAARMPDSRMIPVNAPAAIRVAAMVSAGRAWASILALCWSR